MLKTNEICIEEENSSLKKNKKINQNFVSITNLVNSIYHYFRLLYLKNMLKYILIIFVLFYISFLLLNFLIKLFNKFN